MSAVGGSEEAGGGVRGGRPSVDELKLRRDGHLGFGPSSFLPHQSLPQSENDDYDDAYEVECCWECHGEGGWHDCMEDCCACLAKDEITDVCPTCKGTGEIRVTLDSEAP